MLIVAARLIFRRFNSGKTCKWWAFGIVANIADLSNRLRRKDFTYTMHIDNRFVLGQFWRKFFHLGLENRNGIASWEFFSVKKIFWSVNHITRITKPFDDCVMRVWYYAVTFWCCWQTIYFAKKAKLTPCKPALFRWNFGRFFKKHSFVNSPVLLLHRVMIQIYQNSSFEGRSVLGRPTCPETGRVSYVLTYSLFYDIQFWD